MTDPDAVVVGSGPNGLAAAIELSRAGRRVVVIEAAGSPGGGLRSEEVTLPGFVHDRCAAIHPLGLASPFFQTIDLPARGLRWIQPPVPLVHVLDGGRAVVLERSLEDTAASLGPDAAAWRRLFGPLVGRAPWIVADALGPVRRPRHPIAYARFGLRAIGSAGRLAHGRFETEDARALVAGAAAHSMLALDAPMTGGVALLFCMLGQAFGWPLAEGGSRRIAQALIAELEAHGGSVVCDSPVGELAEVPATSATLLDLTPRQVMQVAGKQLPPRYAARLARFRYGPGVFKVDWALDGPVPWAAPECSRTASVHVGGSFDEIAAAEAAVVAGRHPERPFVIVAQPSLFDPTRAPAGRHTLWAYCHVPNGSDVDMTDAIESQIERFAPGFRDRILARSVLGPAALQAYNGNYVGGDINGGMQDLRQHFGRPVLSADPYSTPVQGLFLCSSSTPPGGGVHGMCGHFAAKSALRASRRA